jgi:hypothetical protein
LVTRLRVKGIIDLISIASIPITVMIRARRKSLMELLVGGERDWVAKSVDKWLCGG